MCQALGPFTSSMQSATFQQKAPHHLFHSPASPHMALSSEAHALSIGTALGTKTCTQLVRGRMQKHGWNYLLLTIGGGTQQQRREEWKDNTSKHITPYTSQTLPIPGHREQPIHNHVP